MVWAVYTGLAGLWAIMAGTDGPSTLYLVDVLDGLHK